MVTSLALIVFDLSPLASGVFWFFLSNSWIIQGGGIQERQNRDNVQVKAETIQQGSQHFFVKPNSEARLYGEPRNNAEITNLRSATPKDVGPGLVSQASASSNMPFKEQQLKQLRAQCLVFLAFRHDKILYVDFAGLYDL